MSLSNRYYKIYQFYSNFVQADYSTISIALYLSVSKENPSDCTKFVFYCLHSRHALSEQLFFDLEHHNHRNSLTSYSNNCSFLGLIFYSLFWTALVSFYYNFKIFDFIKKIIIKILFKKNIIENKIN